MASRQFLLLFFFTVLHSSGSFASFLAASTIFRCSANLLSRFLRKGSCSVREDGRSQNGSGDGPFHNNSVKNHPKRSPD